MKIEGFEGGLPFTNQPVTLLPSAARTADGTEIIEGVGHFAAATFVLSHTADAGDGSDTAAVYIQRELPNGAWDDIVSFTLIDAADTVPAHYIADVVNGGDSDGNYATAAVDGALAAGTVRNVPWYGRLRIKWDVTVGASDSFTFSVTGLFRV